MARGRPKRNVVVLDDQTGDVVSPEDAARAIVGSKEDEEAAAEEGGGVEIEPEEEGDEPSTEWDEEAFAAGASGAFAPRPRETDPGAVPVANKGFIPLFPDAKNKPKHHASFMKVFKRTPPLDGFKGKLPNPEQVDEEYLAGLYGDGIYDLELLDQMGNILRKRAGVKVSMGIGAGGAKPDAGPAAPGVDVEAIVAKITETFSKNLQAEREALKAERAAEMQRLRDERAAEKERNDRFIGMQTTLVKEQSTSMQAFYQAGIASASESSKALLMIMTTGHQQMMEQMRAAHAIEAQNNNPLLLLQAFQAGLGERTGEGGDADPTERVVAHITDGLKSLKDLAQSPRNGGAPAAGATKKLVKQNPGPAATSTAIAKTPATKPGAGAEKGPISKTSLAAILRLKDAAEKKGVSFDDLIAQAEKFYVDGTVPDGILEEEEGPEEDADDELDDGGADEPEAEKPAAKPADEVEGTKPS